MTLSERTRFFFFLSLITVIAAVPRLWLGSSQYVEYDGFWHVFIAQQDDWKNFWYDVYVNAHPPLYFLLLKAALHFGHTILIYRAISLISGALSVFLAGWIARKVTGSSPWALVTALTYGLALPGIIISCEVRSYMLSVFFILISCLCLIELVPAGSGHGAGLRIGFALAAILGCLSHYFAFFYAGAAVLILLVRFVLLKLRGKPGSWKAEAATTLPILAVIYGLFRTHAGLHAQIQGHLLPYYFARGGAETVQGFLLRNWKNFINLFSPYAVSSDTTALVLLAAGVTGGIVVSGLLLLRTGGAVAIRAFATFSITVFMLGAIVLASLAGKYPFGGDLRQQYLLFPFLVICAGICAGTLTAMMPRRGRIYLTAIPAIAIVGISALRFEQFPKVSTNIAQDRMQAFDQLEPAPAAVYLDQFNLIIFFIFHHQWQWSSLKPDPPIPGIDVYRLQLGSRRMLVFRDKTEWNSDPDDASVYHRLAESLRTEKIREISAFTSRQSPPKDPFVDMARVRRTVATQASASAICVEKMAVNPIGWYATFRQSDCDSAAPPDAPFRLTGAFDDVSGEIEYTGAWTHGSYPPAASGTVSFSNAPGSALRLSFNGTEITYVYTKAFNRGIAALSIDGAPRGDVDLYSPQIVWQSRATFGGLAPGIHMFEVKVSGRKDEPATDRYVDVDALIVR